MEFFSTLDTKLVADILIYTSGVLWGIECIPQIVKTNKSKNVEGVSLGFFIVGAIAYTLYMVAQVMLQNWSIYLAHIPSTVFFFYMLYLICKYRNNEKPDPCEELGEVPTDKFLKKKRN